MSLTVAGLDEGEVRCEAMLGEPVLFLEGTLGDGFLSEEPPVGCRPDFVSSVVLALEAEGLVLSLFAPTLLRWV